MKTQPLLTYKIKYSFPDYPNEWETTIYCDFEPNDILSKLEIKKRLESEIIGEEIDDLEIEFLSNTFCDDNLLSLMVVSILNGGFHKVGKTVYKDKLVQSMTEEKKELALCYISYVYGNLSLQEKEQYRENLIKEITDSLTCYNYQIDRWAINYILGIWGDNLQESESVRNKLSKLTNEGKEKDRRYAILCSLTDNNIPKFKDSLDRIFKKYHLGYESNQKRIAAIIYLIMVTYDKKFNAPFQGNYSAIMKNICEYWGIDVPTYRVGDIFEYRDADTIKQIKKRKLESKVKNNNYLECIKVLDEGIWNNLRSS